MSKLSLSLVHLNNFKSHIGLTLPVGDLEVLVGPNGSGKSTFLSFLQTIRNLRHAELRPEIIEGGRGQNVFSIGTDSFDWLLVFPTKDSLVSYHGQISGPIGNATITKELIHRKHTRTNTEEDIIQKSQTEFSTSKTYDIPLNRRSIAAFGQKRSILSLLSVQGIYPLQELWEYIENIKTYSAYNINSSALKSGTLLQQTPQLEEDCSNLSSVLHYFMTEHPQVFNEIQFHLKQLVPGFSHLTVKARGGPGEVMAFWREQGVEQDLSLADLSDGILRLLCWMVLFLHPKPPTLICIDEPDLGVHPRTLPLLAGLIKKASARTQIFVTTHNSYFLSQFDLENITVFRKENGATKAHKPKDSKTLVELLEEFGQGEIAAMHITEELELL